MSIFALFTYWYPKRELQYRIWVFFLSLEFVCPGNYSKCDDGLQCVYVSELCNGWSRCKDGSDETESWCRGIDINYTHNQFNIYYYNGGRIYFGGPRKSYIVLINVHDP
jgi:hypothetical protein